MIQESVLQDTAVPASSPVAVPRIRRIPSAIRSDLRVAETLPIQPCDAAWLEKIHAGLEKIHAGLEKIHAGLEPEA